MLGKLSRVNSLQLRKHLLIAESELNRAQLAAEVAALTDAVRTLTDRVKSFGSIAASATALAGVLAFKRGQAANDGAKPSWRQMILKGAGLISILWPAIRPPNRDQNDK